MLGAQLGRENSLPAIQRTCKLSAARTNKFPGCSEFCSESFLSKARILQFLPKIDEFFLLSRERCSELREFGSLPILLLKLSATFFGFEIRGSGNQQGIWTYTVDPDLKQKMVRSLKAQFRGRFGFGRIEVGQAPPIAYRLFLIA